MPAWLYWLPRILCLLFAIFISLFALDVFQPGQSIGKMLLGLLIHLIPTFLILIVLALSWRWEWIGALVYIGLGLLYLWMVKGKESWVAMAAISGPLILIGLLFLSNWIYKLRAAHIT